VPQRNKTKPEGNDCCDEAVPSAKPSPGVSRTPPLGGWFTRHRHDFSDITSRNFSCCHGLWVFTKPKSSWTSEKRAGWMPLAGDGEGSASRPQRPPGERLNPHLRERSVLFHAVRADLRVAMRRAVGHAAVSSGLRKQTRCPDHRKRNKQCMEHDGPSRARRSYARSTMSG